jgi:hypothetical protein
VVGLLAQPVLDSLGIASGVGQTVVVLLLVVSLALFGVKRAV